MRAGRTAAAIACLLALAACDGLRLFPDSGPGMSCDACDEGAWDGGAPDVPEPRTTSELGRLDDGAGIDPAACVDGIDFDEDGFEDCEDDDCDAEAVCCVGSADCCGADPAALPSPSFEGCGAVGDIETCTTDVRRFGRPSPWVVETADEQLLHPGGSDYDSGITVGAPVDLTSRRVTLSASFAAVSCMAECIESVGVGLTAQATLGDTSYVRPVVALLMTGSRAVNEVHLVVADEVVNTWTHDSPDAVWRLVTRPGGKAHVYRDGAHQGEVSFTPVAGARVVVWGRNRNRPAGNPSGAAVSGLQVTSELCDVADSWPDRDAVVVVATSYTSPRMRAPSLEYGGGAAALAFGDVDIDGDGDRNDVILLARRVVTMDGDETRFTLERGLGNPALQPTADHDMGGVRDPELVWDGDASAGRWVMYYTAESLAGVVGIGRAEQGATTADDAFQTTGLVLPPAGDVVAYEMPTVVRESAGSWLMVVRARRAGGSHVLALFGSADGESWNDLGGRLGDMTLRGENRQPGFDGDEIASPSLVRGSDGVLRLYYAGRRGTRWGVGLLASPDGTHWRAMDPALPVLAGDGTGFDRVGVTEPDAVLHRVTDPETGSRSDTDIEIVYAGTDGSAHVVGRVHRQLASGAARARFGGSL